MGRTAYESIAGSMTPDSGPQLHRGRRTEATSARPEEGADRTRYRSACQRVSGGNEEGPGKPSPPVECGAVELRDQDAVAVSDDLAARNLGLVRDQRLELLVADPRGDDLRRLLALLRRLEETEELKTPLPASIR
jgi:hypothetical protein